MKHSIPMVALTILLAAAAWPARAGAQTNCHAIEAQIHAVQHQIADVQKSEQDDLDEAGPGQKSAIIKEHKKEREALEKKLAELRAQFKACVTAPAPRVPMTIRVSGIHCAVETDENAGDEPYVLVLAVDVTAQRVISVGGQIVSVTVPASHVGLTGPWDSVDHGENHVADELEPALRTPFWSLGGVPRAIQRPDDVIFLAALMENDDAKPKSVRSMLDGLMTASLAGATGDRAAILNRLIGDMNSNVETARLGGLSFLNGDEPVGPVHELRVTESRLNYVAHMGQLVRSLEFAGDGGRYRVDFEFRAA